MKLSELLFTTDYDATIAEWVLDADVPKNIGITWRRDDLTDDLIVFINGITEPYYRIPVVFETKEEITKEIFIDRLKAHYPKEDMDGTGAHSS